MSTPRVLVAHERGAVRQVIARVRELEGFDAVAVASAADLEAQLASARFDALVLDVALSGLAPWEACARARALASGGRGAAAIVLVASVYRSTSYKRRPTSLYGADDYVELHHIGDALPGKLRRVLGLPSPAGDPHLDAGEALRIEGDRRLSEQARAADLARLIVADMVLYNGDRIVGAVDFEAAEAAVAGDLAGARELFSQLFDARTGARTAAPTAVDDAIAHAFVELMAALGRRRRA
ncbi:MAG: hypothetical protein IPN32_24760 [Deltaproteobacteria bacterium]|nr:hypothetical protein [Deltaproteobacteria bacterium]